jgi:hypothetical protein
LLHAISVILKKIKQKLGIGHVEVTDMLIYGAAKPILGFGKNKIE